MIKTMKYLYEKSMSFDLMHDARDMEDWRNWAALSQDLFNFSSLLLYPTLWNNYYYYVSLDLGAFSSVGSCYWVNSLMTKGYYFLILELDLELELERSLFLD